MRRPIVAVAGGDPTTIERQGGYGKTPNVHVFTNLRDSVQFGSRSRGAQPAAPIAPAAK